MGNHTYILREVEYFYFVSSSCRWATSTLVVRKSVVIRIGPRNSGSQAYICTRLVSKTCSVLSLSRARYTVSSRLTDRSVRNIPSSTTHSWTLSQPMAELRREHSGTSMVDLHSDSLRWRMNCCWKQLIPTVTCNHVSVPHLCDRREIRVHWFASWVDLRPSWL